MLELFITKEEEMVEHKYASAMREVLEYLKGISDKDVAKISKNFLDFLRDNAAEELIKEFDYNKPLVELELSSEAKAIIGVIYYNFWCETEQQKRDFLRLLNTNEIEFQKELKEKYDIDNIFDSPKESNFNVTENVSEKGLLDINNMKWYERLFEFFRRHFKK